MLTGQDNDADTILAWMQGRMIILQSRLILVLLARIRSQLRQFEQTEDAIFCSGPIFLSLHKNSF